MKEKDRKDSDVLAAPGSGLGSGSDLLISVTRIKEAQARDMESSDGGSSGRSDSNDKAIEW
jgi:hypothetical protein